MTTFIEFCKTNCIWVELGLLVLAFLFLLFFLGMAASRSGLKKLYRKETEQFSATVAEHNNRLKAAEMEAKKYKDENRELQLKFKQTNSDLEKYKASVNQLTESLHEKLKVEEMHQNYCEARKVEYGALKHDYDELKVHSEETDSELEALKEEKEKLEKDYKMVSSSNLDNALAKNRAESALEEANTKIADLLEENDELRNLEVENKILIRTIRRLSEYDSFKTEKVILNEEPKYNPPSEKMVDFMSRTELFNAAKKAGIVGYTTWTNEKIREELKKKI